MLTAYITWLLTFGMMIALIRYYKCEDEEYHILYDSGHIAMDADCCCCATCRDLYDTYNACADGTPPYAQVSFTDVADWTGGTPWCDYCDWYFNDRTFELACSDVEGCVYVHEFQDDAHRCLLDDIRFYLYRYESSPPYTGASVPGYFFGVQICDNEPSPTFDIWFLDPVSGPFDCMGTFTPTFRKQDIWDPPCDWSGATCTVVTSCWPMENDEENP